VTKEKQLEPEPTDMERFFTALMQALHDAYALGWKDRGDVEGSAG
jgi:hypothetical protein